MNFDWMSSINLQKLNQQRQLMKPQFELSSQFATLVWLVILAEFLKLIKSN